MHTGITYTHRRGKLREREMQEGDKQPHAGQIFLRKTLWGTRHSVTCLPQALIHPHAMISFHLMTQN